VSKITVLPPSELHNWRVLLCDYTDIHDDSTFPMLEQWCKENCRSLTDSLYADVTDTSSYYDTIFQFDFDEEYDTTLFLMRWGR